MISFTGECSGPSALLRCTHRGFQNRLDRFTDGMPGVVDKELDMTVPLQGRGDVRRTVGDQNDLRRQCTFFSAVSAPSGE